VAVVLHAGQQQQQESCYWAAAGQEQSERCYWAAAGQEPLQEVARTGLLPVLARVSWRGCLSGSQHA
jgi:hypothetical protein